MHQVTPKILSLNFPSVKCYASSLVHLQYFKNSAKISLSSFHFQLHGLSMLWPILFSSSSTFNVHQGRENFQGRIRMRNRFFDKISIRLKPLHCQRTVRVNVFSKVCKFFRIQVQIKHFVEMLTSLTFPTSPFGIFLYLLPHLKMQPMSSLVIE